MASGDSLNVRIEPAEDESFRQADATAEQSASSFVGESAREQPEWVPTNRARFVLDGEQWEAFCAALDRPAEAIPAVRDLFALLPRPT